VATTTARERPNGRRKDPKTPPLARQRRILQCILLNCRFAKLFGKKASIIDRSPAAEAFTRVERCGTVA
jgi:hypothetical protein